jgi:hypothetical protein
MAFTSDVLTTLSLDNSLSVLLKLNKQLKISRNNSPRINQGISDLDTRNMEFFFFFFFFSRFFFFFFFFDQQLAFVNNKNKIFEITKRWETRTIV